MNKTQSRAPKRRGVLKVDKNYIPENFSVLDKNEVLHELLNYDMMSQDVLEIIRTLKIEKVLEIHPYAITPPKDDNGRWQSYVNSESGRKKIAKKSKKDHKQTKELYNKALCK